MAQFSYTMQDASGNGVLASLTGKVSKNLEPHLERVPLLQGDILLEPGASSRSAYFPEAGKVSLVQTVSERVAEVAMIGREGVVGGSDGLDIGELPGRAIVQIDGWALRLPVEALQEEAERNPSLRKVLLRHHRALFGQVFRSAACNAHHTIERRLARWLLTACDVVESGGMRLAHESIATMLACRRPGVTVAMSELKRAGIIECGKRRIWILKPQELEKAACECYGAIKEDYARLGFRFGMTLAA